MTQPSRGRKSRIVIDVARVQEEARAKKNRGRFRSVTRYLSVTALVVIALVVVALAGTYLWWRSFEKSPAYSLALLVDAAQRDDKVAVDSLIDPDQIAQGFIPQVIDKLAAQNSPVPPQARATLPNVLPQLLPRVRDSIRDEIAAGLKGLSKYDSPRVPFFVKALGVRSASEVKEKGDAATVTAKAGDRTVELGMRRDGERWKIVTLKDDQLAGDIATRLASSVPAQPQVSQPQNPPRRRAGR